jgi:hypothetical protein
MLEGLGPKGEAVFYKSNSCHVGQSSHKSVFHLGRNWVRLKAFVHMCGQVQTVKWHLSHYTVKIGNGVLRDG